MKNILKAALLTPAVVLMFLADIPTHAPLQLQLVPEAHAIFGIWRRHVRRWAVIGTAAVATTATAATATTAAPPLLDSKTNAEATLQSFQFSFISCSASSDVSPRRLTSELTRNL